MILEAIICGLVATTAGMVYYFVDRGRSRLKQMILFAETFHQQAMEQRARRSVSHFDETAVAFETAPLDWPASPITIDDCREIPQYQTTEKYRAAGFPGSWLARHKQTGEVIRVIGWRSSYSHRLSEDAIIKDSQDRVHAPVEFERIYQPGDWRDTTIADPQAKQANVDDTPSLIPEFARSDFYEFRVAKAKIADGAVRQAAFPTVIYATGPAKAMRLRNLIGREQRHMKSIDDLDRMVCERCGALMDDWKSSSETCEELRLRMSDGAIIRHKLPHIFP